MKTLILKIKKVFDLEFVTQAANNPMQVQKAKNAVRTFYFLQVAFAFINLMKIGAVDPERSGFLPIWPMNWAGSIPYNMTAQILAVAFAGASLLACFYWHKRFAKILVFLAFWQVHALDSSFGYINHFYYLPLYALFFFMFLPDTSEDKVEDVDTARKFMLVYWGAIAAIFATYTLSGFWKIYWGILATISGRLSSFSIMAFPEHIARKTIYESREYFFSGILISNPLVAWVSYLGTIYIEFAAFWAAFKPSLHKIWAFIFLFMHVGILLVIGIPFFESVFVLCVIILNSPFTEKSKITDLIFDLPFIGPVFAWVFKSRKTFLLSAVMFTFFVLGISGFYVNQSLAVDRVAKLATKGELEVKVASADLNAVKRRIRSLVAVTGYDNTRKYINTKFYNSESEGGSMTYHIIQHYFGELVYSNLGVNGVVYCGWQLPNGCIHGVVSKAFEEEGMEATLSKVTEACKTLGKLKNPCAHELGHVILVTAGGNGNLDKAMQGCKLLGKEFSVGSCYSGIFMQRYFPKIIEGDSGNKQYSAKIFSLETGGSVDVLSKDPAFYASECSKIKNPEHKTSCILYTTELWGVQLNHDWKKILLYCDSYKSGDVTVCLNTVGYTAADFFEANASDIQKACANLPEGKMACLYGAMEYMTVSEGLDKVNTSKNLCGKDSEQCLKNVSDVYFD